MKQELIYKGRKISVFREEHELPDGRRAQVEVVRHPGAVVILPQASDGRLYLLKQFRPAIGKTIYEFPAGTLEIGEEPSFCAARELEEEIGMSAAHWVDLGNLLPAPGFCDELQYCYFAKDLTPKSRPMDEDEVIEVELITLPDLMTLIRQGELLDGKSLAILLKAQTLGLL